MAVRPQAIRETRFDSSDRNISPRARDEGIGEQKLTEFRNVRSGALNPHIPKRVRASAQIVR
jgi:hypothetical protein